MIIMLSGAARGGSEHLLTVSDACVNIHLDN